MFAWLPKKFRNLMRCGLEPNDWSKDNVTKQELDESHYASLVCNKRAIIIPTIYRYLPDLSNPTSVQ